MIYQFKDESDELFVLDIVHMRWGIASSILSTPSVAAAENKLARFIYKSEGELVPMGAGAYGLDGRTEKDGVSVVGIMAVPFEDKLVLYCRPNVNIKPDSFVSGFPEEAQKFIKYQILQPNPEKLAATEEQQSQ